jgi:hypothetical protein
VLYDDGDSPARGAGEEEDEEEDVLDDGSRGKVGAA